ncbi:MAG TPA: hypothetical protein VFP85_11755 [Vicinamibacterales bacterium]|nr:hypothetical protein [Vicinamibacterales bacterium]
MAELKTKATKASVSTFLNGIKDEERRKDCKAVAAMMRKATGARPRMWGPSIVGFGSFHYTGARRRRSSGSSAASRLAAPRSRCT